LTQEKAVRQDGNDQGPGGIIDSNLLRSIKQLEASGDVEEFERYSRAEKMIGHKLGDVLAAIIHDAEILHGVRIGELRVSLDATDRDGPNGITANCVIVR